MSKIFIISGGSGAGKTYLLRNIDKISKELKIVQKITSRERRTGEKEYDLKFGFSEEDVKKCDFYYQHREKWYGINKKDIDDVIKNGQCPIFVVRRVSSIIDLKKIYPGAVNTILFKSSLTKEELSNYLSHDGTPLQEIDKRLFSKYEDECRTEYEQNSDVFDYTVVNNYDEEFIKTVGKYLLGKMQITGDNL